MDKYSLRNKEIRNLIRDFSKDYVIDDLEILQKSKLRVDCLELEDAKIYFFSKIPLMIRIRERLYPSLFFDLILARLSQIYVDLGAIAYICNGADIMRPGIRKIEGKIEKGSTVLIRDETHSKNLAIGVSLVNEEEMSSMKKGKVIENIHYVGDRIWNLISKESIKKI